MYRLIGRKGKHAEVTAHPEPDKSSDVRRQESRITVLTFMETGVQKKEFETMKDCNPPVPESGLRWIDIVGGTELSSIKSLSESLRFHPHIVEEIITEDQRPKMEEYEEHISIVLKMILYNESENKIVFDQVIIVFGNDMLLTVSGKENDLFHTIQKKIQHDQDGKARKISSDNLACTLLNAIISQYFPVFRKFGDEIEELEAKLVSNPSSSKLRVLYKLKRDLNLLRKSVWPLIEVLNSLQKIASSLVSPSTKHYLKDLENLTTKAIDTIEILRDMISDIFDIYVSSTNHRMNEIMKLLTVIATIFIPLTFLTGLYGMNFRYMPELTWKWSYPVILSVMLILGVGMFVLFRKRKWM
jgi:magnesium transporter